MPAIELDTRYLATLSHSFDKIDWTAFLLTLPEYVQQAFIIHVSQSNDLQAPRAD